MRTCVVSACSRLHRRIAEFRRQPPGAMKCICEGRETTFGPGEPAAWLLATVHASRHHHQ